MASADAVPGPLIEQLAEGGRLVMPIGKREDQKLIRYRKTKSGLKEESVMSVRLKPMEGKAAGHAW